MEMKHRILSHFLSILASAAIFSAIASPTLSFGQVTYSYRDENGVLVLTNIAPNRPVRDLKVYGVPVPPPQPATVAPAPAVKASKNMNKTGAQITKAQDPDVALDGPISRPWVPNDAANGAAQPTATASTSHPAAGFGLIIEKYAKEFQLDPKLVRSVIATESGFQERAVSPKGALGLMQLMPSTASKLGVHDPFDPEQNIRGGTKHLRFLMDTFNDDLLLSLAAYNAGENLVQRLGRIPDIRETHDYVRSVTARYGGKQMKKPVPQPASRPIPSVFRYLDRNGILVLTNIPPASASGSMIFGQGQSPQ